MKKEKRILKEHIVQSLRKYKKDNKLSNLKLSRMIGCSNWTVTTWLKGRYMPREEMVRKMRELGIVRDVLVNNEVQQSAVKDALVTIDKTNKVPRKYRKRVMMPDIISNQIKLILDDYVDVLNTSMPYMEFINKRSEIIDKLFYTCKQGE